MTYKFYRGDGRTPAEIKKAGGFTNWKAPLSVAQARSLILRTADTTVDVDLPEKSDWNKLIIGNAKYNLGSYANNIKYSTAKSHTSSYVSTDPSEDCGGYANEGYVYEVVYDTLYLGAAATGTFAAPIGATPFKVRVKPKIVLNTLSLDTSDVVAVCCIGEVCFFTPILYANVRRYKPSQGTGWINMPP